MLYYNFDKEIKIKKISFKLKMADFLIAYKIH